MSLIKVLKRKMSFKDYLTLKELLNDPRPGSFEFGCGVTVHTCGRPYREYPIRCVFQDDDGGRTAVNLGSEKKIKNKRQREIMKSIYAFNEAQKGKQYVSSD